MNCDINTCTTRSVHVRNIATEWISSQTRPEPFCRKTSDPDSLTHSISESEKEAKRGQSVVFARG